MDNYRLCPSRKVPLAADQPMCMQNSVDDVSFHNVCANDRRIHGIRVLTPCCLCNCLPWMAGIGGKYGHILIGWIWKKKNNTHRADNYMEEWMFKQTLCIANSLGGWSTCCDTHTCVCKLYEPSIRAGCFALGMLVGNIVRIGTITNHLLLPAFWPQNSRVLRKRIWILQLYKIYTRKNLLIVCSHISNYSYPTDKALGCHPFEYSHIKHHRHCKTH